MTWLWIVLAVLGVLALLLWLPVRFDLDYEKSGLVVRLRFGLIRLRLLPRKPKAKKPAAPKPDTPAPKKKRSISSLYAAAQRYIPLVKKLLRLVPAALHAVVIDRLSVTVRFYDEDPADLALRYGQIWAAIGGMSAALSRVFQIRQQDLQPVIDPQAEGFELEANVRVHVTLWQVCGLGIRLLILLFQKK